VAESEHSVIFHFRHAQNRELPLVIGQMPVLHEHYWADREFGVTTLLGAFGQAAPYRISASEWRAQHSP